MHFYFIPQKENIGGAVELSKKYDMGWELNDFMYPDVYDDEAEVQRVIELYKATGRDFSFDTMHGAFLGVDIAATDPAFKLRSQKLCRQSMEIASKLSLKGVVFHTGLIGTLRLESYVNHWLDEAEKLYGELCSQFPSINIYLENSFEQEPDVFIKLMQRMQGYKNFKLCLDYGHAILTSTPVDKWVTAFAPFLGHMHLNDNDLHDDLHMPVGSGKIDFAEWYSLMQNIGYSGSVLLEMNGCDKAEQSINYIQDKILSGQTASVDSPVKADRRKYDRRQSDRMQKILDIGIALSIEADPNKLLSFILDNAMELTNCDGGSLYMLKEDGLHFRIMKTASKGVNRILPDGSTEIPPIPLKEENVCAYAAIHKKSLNISDVYASELFDFSGPKSYDAANSYRTRSMVAIPMIDHRNEVLGVMQLINAMGKDGELIEFSEENKRIISSLASQTAICVSNIAYLKELDEQIWSFTEAMTEVIDMRTPYNGNHTKQVAKYVGMIAEHFNKLHNEGVEETHFSDEHMAQMVMSAYLHDIGKMTIPVKIMNKCTRLEHHIDTILTRLENIRLRYENDKLNGYISSDEYNGLIHQLDEAVNLANEVNSDKPLSDELLEKIEMFAGLSYVNHDSSVKIPFFNEDEIMCMKIKRGTLTDEERKIMQDHVVVTKKILDKVHFNRSFAKAPVWASQHHEFLNGSGYPNHLEAESLGIESRILAVADICDALLSTDRPYKKPMPKEKAFSIMKEMAEEGKLDLKCVEYLEACI